MPVSGDGGVTQTDRVGSRRGGCAGGGDQVQPSGGTHSPTADREQSCRIGSGLDGSIASADTSRLGWSSSSSSSSSSPSSLSSSTAGPSAEVREAENDVGDSSSSLRSSASYDSVSLGDANRDCDGELVADNAVPGGSVGSLAIELDRSWKSDGLPEVATEAEAEAEAESDEAVMRAMRGNLEAWQVTAPMAKGRETVTRGWKRGLRGLLLSLVDARTPTFVRPRVSMQIVPLVVTGIEFIQLFTLALFISRLAVPDAMMRIFSVAALDLLIGFSSSIGSGVVSVFAALAVAAVTCNAAVLYSLRSGSPEPPALVSRVASGLGRVLGRVLYLPALHALLQPLGHLWGCECASEWGLGGAMFAAILVSVHAVMACVLVANLFPADPRSGHVARRANSWLDVMILFGKTWWAVAAVATDAQTMRLAVLVSLAGVAAVLAGVTCLMQPFFVAAMNKAYCGLFAGLAAVIVVLAGACSDNCGSELSMVAVASSLLIGLGAGALGARVVAPSRKSMTIIYYVGRMLHKLELGYVAADVYEYNLERLLVSPQRLGLYGNYLAISVQDYDGANVFFEAAFAHGVTGTHIGQVAAWRGSLGEESTMATAFVELALRLTATPRAVVLSFCTSPSLDTPQRNIDMMFLHLRQLVREIDDVELMYTTLNTAEVVAATEKSPQFPFLLQQLLWSRFGGSRLAQLGSAREHVVARFMAFAAKHRSTLSEDSVNVLADIIRGPEHLMASSTLAAAMQSQVTIIVDMPSAVGGLSVGGIDMWSSVTRVNDRECNEASPSSHRYGFGAVLAHALTEFIISLSVGGAEATVIMVENYNVVDRATHAALRVLLCEKPEISLVVVTDARAHKGGRVLDEACGVWAADGDAIDGALDESVACLSTCTSIERFRLEMMGGSSAMAKLPGMAGLAFDVVVGESTRVCAICCASHVARDGNWLCDTVPERNPSEGWVARDSGSLASATIVFDPLFRCDESDVAGTNASAVTESPLDPPTPGISTPDESCNGLVGSGLSTRSTVSLGNGGGNSLLMRPESGRAQTALSHGEVSSDVSARRPPRPVRSTPSRRKRKSDRPGPQRSKRRVAPGLMGLDKVQAEVASQQALSSMWLGGRASSSTSKRMAESGVLCHDAARTCAASLRSAVLDSVLKSLDLRGLDDMFDSVAVLLELAAVVGRSHDTAVLALAYARLRSKPDTLGDTELAAMVQAAQRVEFQVVFRLLRQMEILESTAMTERPQFAFVYGIERFALLATLSSRAIEFYSYHIGRALAETDHSVYSHPLMYIGWSKAAWDTQLLIPAYIELVGKDATRSIERARELLLLIHHNDRLRGSSVVPAHMQSAGPSTSEMDSRFVDGATPDLEAGQSGGSPVGSEVLDLLTPHLHHVAAKVPGKYLGEASSFAERAEAASGFVKVSMADRQLALTVYAVDLLRRATSALFNHNVETENIDDVVTLLDAHANDVESQLGANSVETRVRFVQGDLAAAHDSLVAGAMLARAEGVTTTTSRSMQKMYTAGGWVLWKIGDFKHSHAWQRIALRMARMLDDPSLTVYAMTGLGIAARDMGRSGEAEAWLLQARHISQWIGNLAWMAYVDSALMTGYLRSGELTKARNLCIETYDKCALPWAVDKALTTLLSIAVLQHDQTMFQHWLATVMSASSSRLVLADALALAAMLAMQGFLLVEGLVTGDNAVRAMRLPHTITECRRPLKLAIYGYGSLEVAAARTRLLAEEVKAVGLAMEPAKLVPSEARVIRAAMMAVTLVAADVLARGQEVLGELQLPGSRPANNILVGFDAIRVDSLAEVGATPAVDDAEQWPEANSEQIGRTRWDVLAYMNLVPEMRAALLKSRRAGFKRYDGVFVAAELIDWLIEYGMASSRATAVIHGIHMMEYGLIAHVERREMFADSSNLLFVFFV
ncbi:uncharacterized protein AMSG_11681 [Thecamonas trahens ATCC 50062]|uniref:DEP domain-containing protein n=1 Tax=Thecamonas trahens ATCC 50062 TaxID=461836 RepID=A0A0L0DTP6_THETB|nr:hypothetical protein AMSG_11681 [Thecamonas trahens ATCC 50062]KNC55704.1 hypothetical protein AMSG_11681 [Thecamonas trahens ATCC 50062]|eukprot:XP_013761487.1 hypothetical protein AMSG_11681 [Thecamonas trahens ATCC 50062]